MATAVASANHVGHCRIAVKAQEHASRTTETVRVLSNHIRNPSNILSCRIERESMVPSGCAPEAGPVVVAHSSCIVLTCGEECS
jgi:hypothetical protein